MNTYIDLRSDTVTAPTPEMRKAIASAEVGDDGRLLPGGYYGDPTVRELEDQVASLLGKPAALFTPTGVQANMIALRVWCERNDLVAVGSSSHLLRRERGAFDDRYFGLRSHLFDDDEGFPARLNAAALTTKLLCVENTHNAAGGLPWHPDRLTELLQEEASVPPVHIDGARLFNAAVALKLSPAKVASAGDSVMICLSKGLGAPMGSLLAGDAAWIRDARRVRKLFGGQMRQAGVAAAAGLYALKGFDERLQRDHERAENLASGLKGIPGLAVQDPVTTNMVRATILAGPEAGARLLSHAADLGVLLAAPANGELRLVTHSNISDEDVVRAVSVIAETLNRSTQGIESLKSM